jgi:dTMP kinase
VPNGLFITFEGIDFTGKSSQAGLLCAKLEGLSLRVLKTRDPGTTRISEHIRDILLNTEHAEMSPWTELLLYEAARAQMVLETIQPALNEGIIVLCDRFYDSTTAYQGYGRELSLNFVQKANELGSTGLVPDLTFIIDLEPDVAVQRKTKAHVKEDRLEAEGRIFFERVAHGYRKIASLEPERIVLLNGDQKIEEIHAEIWKVFKKKFLNSKN